ncbi:MAG: TRAP transporter large permease [Peptococcaceae bacterium]|jgi:C4-dicarboxylate transporter DctM subunit|nr:TRAP transporter large permease [Peptococcaceae bacterium]MDH7524989.1 TRAP transporter large permease [Peptococcaceae bacterium]
MEPGTALFLIFAVLLVLNVPIAVSLGASSLVALYLMGVPFSMYPMVIYAAMARFTLLAIPFFIMAGIIMEKAGISHRLIKLANTAVGHLPAGLAIVAVITSCFFAAISGSGPATVAALGTMLIPAMVKAGYDVGMSSALLASSGAIGIIIPPSIAFVIYGVVAEVSIGKLFIAGIVPGLLIGLGFIIASLLVTMKKQYGLQDKAPFRETWAAFKDALWGLMTPVIILGGIYGGVFTPTEAAAVAVVYGLFVGVFIYREIRWKEFVRVLVDSAVSSAVVMLIVSTASLFAWVITTEGITETAGQLILSITQNKYMILLLINILLLIAGCFIDAISAMYILVPILLPLINFIGYDPLVFGVVFTANMAIGQVTPPVGVNLYVACGIAGIPIKTLTRALPPFLIASLVALMLITYFPELSLWLPNLMGLK